MTKRSETPVLRKFLVLRATRWFPTGLIIPVLVLLLVSRGFSLAQIGLAAAAQGLVVFLLELPTGGLADAIGRRPVLLAAAAADLVSHGLMLIVDSIPMLVGVFLLQGVYRSLESGPLDAWFVDTAQEADPEADIERALARGGLVIGIAIATGAAISGGLVALDPIDGINPLVVPVAVAVGLRLIDVIAMTSLLTENRVAGPRRTIRASLDEASAIVVDSVAIVRGSAVLAALVAVEFIWGFGMVAFEALAPPRFADLTEGTDSAAAVFGPTVMIAWVVFALGSAAGPYVSKRLTTAGAAMVAHALQAVFVVGMAMVGGLGALIVFYIATMGMHGLVGPLYQTLLHAEADAEHRTTVLSAASMAFHPGGAMGAILLGALADRASVSTAMMVGAAVLAAVIPLYLPALRQAKQA